MGSAQSSPAQGKLSSGATRRASVAVLVSNLECARAIQAAAAEIQPEDPTSVECGDFSSRLTDDCLGIVFGKLGSRDRNSCSLVCRRWFRAEARSRQLLLLSAKAELAISLPDLLTRFEHLTRLALRCDRKDLSLGDGELFLIGKYAKQLERLKLKGCRQVSDAGLEEFSKVCTGLKKLSCGSCGFGAKGLNALMENSGSLEDLSVKRLRSLLDEPNGVINPGHQKLKRLCLKDLANGQVFEPLLRGSRNLQTLILARLSGDWNRLLSGCMGALPKLAELRMEKLLLKDEALHAISGCKSLQVLYVVKCPECTNSGLSAIAQGCRSIRKLHIDGCFMGRIGDEGLRAIGERCRELQELVLIRINVNAESMGVVGLHCGSLERLAICNSETFGDSELSSVVFRCLALKKLCIKSCPISDAGLEALAGGCPNLVKVKIKKCRRVSAPGASQLQRSRGSLVLVVDLPVADENNIVVATPGAAAGSSSSAAAPEQRLLNPRYIKTRLSFLAGPSNFVACTIRRITPS